MLSRFLDSELLNPGYVYRIRTTGGVDIVFPLLDEIESFESS